MPTTDDGFPWFLDTDSAPPVSGAGHLNHAQTGLPVLPRRPNRPNRDLFDRRRVRSDDEMAEKVAAAIIGLFFVGGAVVAIVFMVACIFGVRVPF